MKKSFLNLLTTATILSLMIFISCGGGGKDDDDQPTEQEVQFDLLEGTWNLSSADNDGAVDGWDNFTLTIGGSATSISYSTNQEQPEGTEAVWPASGTLAFVGESITALTRSNDNIEITVSSVSETSLTITFSIPPQGGGRLDVVEGNWTMVFDK